MSKTYLPYDPDQQLLLPAALQEWLPPEHLAYFISDVVDQLDLSAITVRYEEERRGGPPYHPRMMVKVLLYGYCTGVASSRRIAQRLHEDIGFRVLAANNTPDFRTVSDFRKDHLQALGGLFLQVLALCQQAGLVKLGHVALDGTKVRANASRNKAMSYGRMKEKEAQLKAEVAELLRKAGEVDDDEDHRYGRDKRGDELPEELAFRESRLRKIREARAALEAKPWRRRSRLRGKEGIIPGCLMTRRSGTSPPGLPHHARPGRAGLPGNCQAVVDSSHQVIVAARATDPLGQAAGGSHGGGDHRQRGRGAERSIRRRRVLLGQAVDGRGVDPVAPEKTHGRVLELGLSPRDRMRRKLRTKRGRERYALNGDGGTGVRPDQAGPGLPAVPAAGPGES